MKFVVDGTKYELDEMTLTFAEARAMQKATGLAFGEIGDRAGKGDLECVQALLWVAMKRTEHTKKFTDLDQMEIGSFEQLEEGEPDPTQDDGQETSTPND